MSETTPNVPGLYDLVVVERTDSAKAYAQRLAERGAEEGTLVWAKKQSEGVGRRGNYWMSGEKNLHCALVLRPEDPFEICCQLSLLASVCAVQAITLVGEPMEELRLGWPNDVYLNRGKVAGVHLGGELGPNDAVNWMVLSVNINTFNHPTSLGFAASSLRGEGFANFERVELLEGLSRELLTWLDRWADQGLEPVRKAWSWRSDWGDEEHSVDYCGRTHRGTFDSIDTDGTLKLKTTDGIMAFRLDRFHRPDFRITTEEETSFSHET